jgi:Transcription factor WhiB
VIEDDGGGVAGPRPPAATATRSSSSPSPGEQTKAAEAKAICAGCQVRDRCRDLAVNAAGGLDHDHRVFGGTLPAERSRLRGNSFPTPSTYRQRRELAEQATSSPARWGCDRPSASSGSTATPSRPPSRVGSCPRPSGGWAGSLLDRAGGGDQCAPPRQAHWCRVRPKPQRAGWRWGPLPVPTWFRSARRSDLRPTG